MKGSVKRRGNLWMYIVDLPRDENNKRKQKRKGGFKRKQDAELALAQLIADIERGNYVKETKTTFGQYMEQWIADKKMNVRACTFRSYEWLVNKYIIPKLGKIELTKLTPAHIQKFYTALQQQEKPLSNRSILHAHQLIQEALDRALKWGMVIKNVAVAVDPPRPKKADFQIWSPEDIQRFLDVARGERFYIAFILAITTGMRKGEILGLRWQDIDFKNSLLSVRQILSYTGHGHEFQQPKTDNSKRAVALPEQVIEVLKHHKIVQATEKLRAGSIYNDLDLVICKEDGIFVPIRTFDNVWNRLRAAADVPKIRFHDLRHTHASLLLLQGVHPKIVSERLGHSTVGITLDTYSHVMPGLQEAAATQFADTIFGENNSKKKPS